MSQADPSAEEPSWHDNLIYSLSLACADADAGNWQSRLILDIDHIVEWICGTDGGAQFLVAPATLEFHDVTDLKISIDFGASGHSQAINELSIDHIAREPAKVATAVGPYDYYASRIVLNLPEGGQITFGASGYTMTLRAEPSLTDQPRLPVGARDYLMPQAP